MVEIKYLASQESIVYLLSFPKITRIWLTLLTNNEKYQSKG